MATIPGSGRDSGVPDPIRPACFEAVEFPPDFPQRLERLKQSTELSWNGFAAAIGVDPRQVSRWRKGVEPCGTSLLALFRLAVQIPGGILVLLALDAPLIGVQGSHRPAASAPRVRAVGR